LPAVDCAVVIDTGSNDNTVEILKDIKNDSYAPLEIMEFTDCNDSEGRINDFSLARNQYIKKLENMGCTHIITCDADDTLETPPHEIKKIIEETGADIYQINYKVTDSLTFLAFKIWRTGLGIRFTGKVHEVIHFDWALKVTPVYVLYRHHPGTHEGQENGTDRNMRILKGEIYPPLRSLFYWANENMDAKHYREAIKWWCEYIRRCKEGESAWPVELAHCYFRAARWLNHVGDRAACIGLCNELLAFDPSWSEAWCELAYIAYEEKRYDEMKKYALKAISNKFESRLFSERDKYEEVPAFYLNMAATLGY
jgi:hypothetical protein